VSIVRSTFAETLPDRAPACRWSKAGRPVVRGKFLYAGSQKLWVRGATYGAFRPDERKREYQNLAAIDRDFRQMAESGFNAVRIPHTTPPRELLDIAEEHGLRVMVGLSAEQCAGDHSSGQRQWKIEGGHDRPDAIGFKETLSFFGS